MRAKPLGLMVVSLIATVASVLGAPEPARAAGDPQAPIYLWGIHRGCALDEALSRATAERLQLLGTPIYALDHRGRLAASRCIGSECAELLIRACGARRPERGSLLGGHVEEQREGAELLSRIRLWRTDLEAGRPTFVRHERLTRRCSGEQCGAALLELISTLAGQLLAESTPLARSAAAIHDARPPYCDGAADLPAFFCAPFNLQAVCGDAGDDADAPAIAERELSCPAPGQADRPSCDCAHPSACAAPARAACSAAASSQRLPRLRKGLGGSLIAAGGLLLGAGVLMSLNNHTDLTLRAEVGCSDGGARAEKCFATPAAIGASFGLGAALIAGGAVMVWDPLRLFSAEKSPSERPRTDLSLVPVRAAARAAAVP